MTSTAEERGPVILFDGVCNLCTGSVRFVLARDSKRRFRFASLQSAAAERLLGERDNLESMVLIEDGAVYRKSTAALRIARRLDGGWPLLAALLFVPRTLRDAVYDWVGRRRYRLFGKRDVCWTPQPELADRFLD